MWAMHLVHFATQKKSRFLIIGIMARMENDPCEGLGEELGETVLVQVELRGRRNHGGLRIRGKGPPERGHRA